MDQALLIDPGFWNDPETFAASEFPCEIPRDPALRNHILFETSGSSGVPKWIAISKQALLLSASVVNRHLGVTSSSHWCLALPTSHVGGVGVVARAFEAACALAVFQGRWNVRKFTKFATRNSITHLSLVPAQVHDLVAARAEGPGSLKVVVVGGGQLNDDIGNAARTLGWPVVASYGMTESASQIATQTPPSPGELYHHAPIPLLPIWNAVVGEDARLHLSGPALFSGELIWGDDQWVYHPREASCYITADLAEVVNNMITPLGRADTRVKVLGELVDPEAIERQLSSLSEDQLKPGGFAVVAIADSRAGHRMIAVAGPGVEPEFFQSLCSLYNKKVVGPQRVAAWVRALHLPVTEMGKIRRQELLRQLQGRESEFMDCQPPGPVDS